MIIKEFFSPPFTHLLLIPCYRSTSQMPLPFSSLFIILFTLYISDITLWSSNVSHTVFTPVNKDSEWRRENASRLPVKTHPAVTSPHTSLSGGCSLVVLHRRMVCIFPPHRSSVMDKTGCWNGKGYLLKLWVRMEDAALFTKFATVKVDHIYYSCFRQSPCKGYK